MTFHEGEEEKSYHALARRAEGDYRTLEKWRHTHGAWTRACEAMGISEKERADAWESVKQHGLSVVVTEAEEFPSMLREMPWSPHGLYVRGASLGEEPSVAIVGTRKASGEGCAIAREFAKELARHGVTVVSGLAFGIDAAAHEGALDAGGKTVAVIASGVDTVYPRAHEALAKRILEKHGTFVSEYPPGSPALPHRFIERNRIVSGLSRGVIVVEAPEASGALATARFALEQNRDVFVVPGPLRSVNYRGSHALLKSGAALVTEATDVLQALGIEPSFAKASAGKQATGNALSSLDETQKMIITVLSTSGKGMSSDAIAEAAHIAPDATQRALGELILLGMVADHGGLFSLSH